MVCDNCMQDEKNCKCEDGPLAECKQNIEAEVYGHVYTGYWICECGAKEEFAYGTEHFVPAKDQSSKKG